MIALPNSDAAAPAVAAPPGSKDSSEPTGARITGMRSLRPNSVVDVSMRETSTHTRGRSAKLSIASRLRRNVVSDSVAPTR